MARIRIFSIGPVLASALAGASLVGGCANVGDSFASGAFVNPARYDLYDCERLRTERVSLEKDAADKQALIDKARTGAGGALVGEVVYRNDYVNLRARKKLADEAWQRNACDAVTPPPLPAPAPTSSSTPPSVPRAGLPSAAPATSAARAIY